MPPKAKTAGNTQVPSTPPTRRTLRSAAKAINNATFVNNADGDRTVNVASTIPNNNHEQPKKTMTYAEAVSRSPSPVNRAPGNKCPGHLEQ
ncbi:hypothetical protein Hypma_012499 [Hypsizygus marmoreus]|uniref:Uncharacterized protein n=1 Tax=Hypsizygus marmoreus TaxID=39966 RepID=A0A369JIL3_HYPMA|nr:hypothetical protein Hypma_012499 [Hypsizygus marmoreus]